jgi:uncharacterized protein YdeI (YjbR/CyaY-like superfamily)
MFWLDRWHPSKIRFRPNNATSLRHAKSNIKQTYKDRFAKLEKLGLVHQAGTNSVLSSKQNGLWHFMDDVDALIKPDDLVQCLNEHPPAMDYFESFSKSNKRFILRWIKLAKTPATRQKTNFGTATLASKKFKKWIIKCSLKQ